MDDEVIILSVETGEAVRNVGDLTNNIKAYKDALKDLDIGSKEYADVLNALQVNQAALKAAMHATTEEGDQQGKTMEQIAKDAMGLGTSYNSLVRQMAKLDEQFRNEEDAVKRAQIGKEINNINNQLKDLDAQRGKFGRNVGNYEGALKNVAANFRAVAGGAGSVINPVTGVTAGLKALSATPVIATLGLLANALSTIIGGMKSSEDNTNSWNRALAAFKPIADAFTRTMQAVGKAVADVSNWIVDLLDKWGLLSEKSKERIALEEQNQEIIRKQRDVALENAKLENEVAKLRDKAAQKDKYTAKERLAYLEQAVADEEKIARNNMELAKARLDAAKKEASLAQNGAATLDKINQLKIEAVNAETNFYTTTRRLQTQMVQARKEILGEAGATAGEVIETINLVGVALDELDYKMDKSLQRRLEREKADEEWNDLFLVNEMDYISTLDALWAEETDNYTAYLDEQLQAANDAYVKEQEIKRQRLQLALTYANSVASLASNIAAAYEVEADSSEDAAQKSKSFKVAAAIISSISGAVAAFTSTWTSELPLAAKLALAPINAASALAAGYAQVRQMQAVRVGKGGGSSVSTPAIVQAPSTGMPAIQQVRTITGASEEQRLNRMASDQRVVLVMSDLEAKQHDQRVQLAESTF